MADITQGAKRAIIALLSLVLIMGGANLWASYDINHSSEVAQQKAGQVVEHKLCLTLNRLAALKPPTGSASTNPSRSYLQQEHAVLAQLGRDIGCK